MKKLLLVVGFSGIAALAHSQGTIAFVGSGLRIQFRNLLGGDAPAPFPCNLAVYFAETPGAWQGPVTPFGRSSAEFPDLVTGPSLLQIPGTEGGQVVSMQIYAWNAQFGDDPYQAWLAGAGTAGTDVRQVTLAPTAGPGAIIWQPANGTNPNRFTPLTFWNSGIGGPPPPVVPEPSTLALGALGGLVLLLCFSKSKKD